MIATVHGSFLCASLEIGMLRRALMYVCELQNAKPRTAGSAQRVSADPSMPPSSSLPLRKSSSIMAGLDMAHTAAQWAGRVSAETAHMQTQAKPVATAVAKFRRNLTMQVFLHCARIDVSYFRPPDSCCMICDQLLAAKQVLLLQEGLTTAEL